MSGEVVVQVVVGYLTCGFAGYVIGDVLGWNRGWRDANEINDPHVERLTRERDAYFEMLRDATGAKR